MDDSCDRLLKVKKCCNIAPGVVDLSIVEDENYIKGGILSNSKLSWISCGPRITNLNNNNGSKKTGWTFGWASGDKSIRVVCVEELPGSSAASPILVVGCESDTSSFLCFYHSGCSRVLKAIHFNDKITSLAVISKSNDVEENLSELLKPWNGMVAVGTNVGKVYLVDVWWRALERCIEDFRHKLHDEQRQSKLVEVTLNDLENDIDLRTSSIRHGSSSLALWLNEVTLERGRVGAHPGLHNILGRMPLEFLTVTALEYFPQISTLAVGYNTSCFQLWDLSSLTLLYTSALLEAMLPVFSFSLLEPSDDPRYVCYLWSLHHSVDEDSIPFAGMYIISYHEKHQRQYNNQFFYEGFSSCSIRYQLDLGAEMSDVASGRIISCQAIHRSTSKTSALWIENESEEPGCEEGTASLLSIAWEVWTPNQQTVYRKLTLFDLNQWYREYMPTSSDMEYSQFMAHFCLPDGQLLDVKVVSSSVRQFQALQPLDEHFYPTATSFDCLLLHQSQVMVCCHVGVQQEALDTLADAGPSGLLLPARLYKQCTQAGLRPLLVEVSSPEALQSSEQRAYLLCVALEHEMTQFLRHCAADWADGSHAVAGCTLPGLLAWAWDRVQRYKKWLDRLCVPLFDYSGAALDTNDMGIFHHMICQLHRLRDLFRLVLDKYSTWIIRGNFEQQHTVINLVTAFYDSVFWCVRNKVLPEVNASEANINGRIPYFADKIMNSTISRRVELHQLGKSLQDPPPPPGLLLIDAVLAAEAGAKVTDQWEREGGAATLGKYPPPSVQSLLRTYLIRGVRPDVKHFVVTYFLLDVAHVLCSLGVSETTKLKLLKYPTDFGLTESQSKIAEAFWCLDHKQFQSGVDLLLDSCVSKDDLQVYQHRIVLCLLAAVGEHKLALRYLTSRRRTPIEPQDIRMEMTLLLVNDLIHEAFQFQRHHQTMSNELLGQFFKGCLEMNKLDVIFKLALTPAEEEAFMAFLDKTSHPQADDLRVLYLLSRSRYVEAIDMNERLRLHSAAGAGTRRGMGLGGARISGAPTKALTTRDLIINSVSKSLPSITRDLADYCHREKHYSWKQINRPTPLSVLVHTELSTDRLPDYKTTDSQLIHAAVSKTREIWAPLLATPAALKRKLHTTVEDTPFLRNPIHSRLNSSVTNFEEVRQGVRSRTDDEESKVSKRARLEFSPSDRDNAQTESTSHKTTEMDITCLESSAVLHTPLVTRIVKKPPKETNTPQSILKGRSGPNTPLTPAREKLASPAVGRQIRFSLPQDDSSQSPTKSEEELSNDGEDYSKATLSPRKSIHETSDLHTRLPTPSNPRVLFSRSLRSSVSRLQFDEPEVPPTNEVQSEPSATAITLLKKISSSPPSSEEAYFSFQSSSSGVESKGDGEARFKILYGLEGNIEDTEDVEGDQKEKTYTEEYEESPNISVESDLSEKEVETNEMESTITPSRSKLSGMASTAFTNQTNETVHLTLEYEGDATSSSFYKTNEKLSQSVNKTFELRYDGDSVDDVELDAQKSLQNVEVRPEEKIVPDTSLSLLRERMSGNQQIIVDTMNREKFSEQVKQDFTLQLVSSSLTTSESVGQDKETGFKEVEQKEKISQNSAVLSEEFFKSDYKDIKTNDSMADKTSNEIVFRTQDSTMPLVSSKSAEVCSKDQHELESVMQDTSLRSVRGSTPLPLILEELVKKGRISLSVPETKASDEFHSLPEEDLEDKEADANTANLPTCDMSEEVVSVENILSERVLDYAQEEIEGGYKPESLVDESKSTLMPELNDVYKKDESVSAAGDDISFKQTFVFGNQASLSTAAANRNLTFTIGLNQFGCTALETEELSSSKLESPQNKDEPVFMLEEEAPKTSDSTVTKTNSESQNYSTFEELAEPSEVSTKGCIIDAHSISAEEFHEEKSSNENAVENIICTTNAEMSQDFTSELPEDEQNQSLNFYTDTAGNAFTNQLEADSTADFELKMSEGESIMEISNYENNEAHASEVRETEEEQVFLTLNPVRYHTEEEQAEEKDDCYFQREEQSEKEENEDDEDIYGDLEKIDSEEEDEAMDEENESVHEEEEDVICLESSSDEEPPKKIVKSSTPNRRQLTPKAIKQIQALNETLDYEVEEEDKEHLEEEEEEEEEEGDSNDSYSSETSLDDETDESENDESDSKIDKKNLYFSSGSDSETSHHRRSWKEQRKQYDSNESLTKGATDEDTVESPPFELIGHDSQEDCKEKLDTIIKETKESSPKLDTVIEEVKDNPPKFDTIMEESKEDSPKLDTAIEETKDNHPEVSSKSTLPLPSQNENNIKEDGTPEAEQDVDIIKLGNENRRRRLETGSILDLKKRRSKRYSSATSLNERSKGKLRRRSCSLHDFMSELIKETKSSSQLSPEKNFSGSSAENVVQGPSSDLQTNELFGTTSPIKITPTKATQPSTASEMEFSETGSITSSLMPEIGSIVSTQTFVGDFTNSSVPKPFEHLKRRGKSFASRLSSLHDISEEISENPENARCPSQELSSKKSLRRSLSTSQLSVSKPIDNSRIRRSSSVCKWSEYAKAHESEMTADISDTTDIRSSVGHSEKQDIHSKSISSTDVQNIEYSIRKSNLRSSASSSFNVLKTVNSSDEEENEHQDARETVQQPECKTSQEENDHQDPKETVQQPECKRSQKDNTNTTEDMVIEDDSNANDTSKFTNARSSSSRLLRGQSEPPSIFQSLAGSRRSRRSSSSTKIDEHHKRILYRSSLRGKSIEPQEFKIIDSDIESPEVTAQQKKETELEQVGIPTEDDGGTSRNNLTNDQVSLPADTVEPVEAPVTSPSSVPKSRTKRGHSEPPTGFHKPNSRTRRSSFSQKIDKYHKMIFPGHLRKSRASSFQPMEIVQSDEDRSFQKTPDEVKEDLESTSTVPSEKEIIETPVTSKKRGRPKKHDNQIKEGTETVSESKESSQEDQESTNKTTQDYPQPPKKRGRPKKKLEDVTSDNAITEYESDQNKEIIKDSRLHKELTPELVKNSETKLQGKKHAEKPVKASKKVVKRNENESSSDEEPLSSFIKVDSESQAEDEIASVNTKRKNKKKKSADKISVDQKDKKKTLENIKEAEDHLAEVSNKSRPRKKKDSNDDVSSTPKKTLKRKTKEEATPPVEENEGENVESSLTESQADEMARPTKLVKEQELLLLDSPARRTRRSMSRLSDTEMLTPTKERPQRRTRRSSVVSDIGLSTPNKYAESDISDVSTEVNLHLTTPRRSTRRPSISSTPNTPDLIPEEFLKQRRLTRHQHSQLQKSFELSFAESPKLSRLEEVPEESVEGNEASLTPSLTPVRSSRRISQVSKVSKSKASKK